MIYHRRIKALEEEVKLLKVTIGSLANIIDDLRVAHVDHPDYEVETRVAKSRLASRGWRIAQQRQMVHKARELQDELKIMAEDCPEVAKMLLKE